MMGNERTIKICYSNVPNIGDAINPHIVREVLHFEPVLTDVYSCQISGIGSGLYRFFVKPKDAFRQASLIRKKLKYTNEVILWSSGFLSTPTSNEFVVRKKIKVASVRGELSKQYLEKILNQELDCTTGDGGLLCSKWVPEEKEKKYRLGIISHRREKGESFYDELHASIGDSIVIDVEGNPVETLKLISSCECIISSSLHGLVIADSYGVPNKRVILTDKLAGDGFKFRDYYSSFGIEDKPVILNENTVIDINSIINDYQISREMVTEKQNEIISAFKRFL